MNGLIVASVCAVLFAPLSMPAYAQATPISSSVPVRSPVTSESVATAGNILVPARTPFEYNVGIAYETDVDGRTGRSITADLDQITQYFQLVRTYHDTASPNSTTPTIDPNMSAVIAYVTSHPTLSLVMGTYNSALVMGSTGDACGVAAQGTSFSPGLMDSQAYTDAWVQMLINAFGGVSEVAHSVKTILLGNEIDLPGTYVPGSGDANYSEYVYTWIPNALTNLKTSLRNAGLGDIPISVTLAFSPASDSTQCPGSNEVSIEVPQYISIHWSPSWNGGWPFALYDQYPSSNPPTFNDIAGYLRVVVGSLHGSSEAFVGETGVQSSPDDGCAFVGGDSQEAAFYQSMFAVLGAEWANGGLTLPVFAFQAFDLPALSETYGLFAQDGSCQPAGLKPGINVPSWVSQSINNGIAATPVSGQAPLDVTFRATGLALPTTYTINFGDGTTGALTQADCFGAPAIGGRSGGNIACSGSAFHTYTTTGVDIATLLSSAGSSLGTVTISIDGIGRVRPTSACCSWGEVP